MFLDRPISLASTKAFAIGSRAKINSKCSTKILKNTRLINEEERVRYPVRLGAFNFRKSECIRSRSRAKARVGADARARLLRCHPMHREDAFIEGNHAPSLFRAVESKRIRFSSKRVDPRR